MEFSKFEKTQKVIIFVGLLLMTILFFSLFLIAKNRDDKYNTYKPKEYKKVVTKTGKYVIIDNKAYRNGGL